MNDCVDEGWPSFLRTERPQAPLAMETLSSCPLPSVIILSIFLLSQNRQGLGDQLYIRLTRRDGVGRGHHSPTREKCCCLSRRPDQTEMC